MRRCLILGVLLALSSMAVFTAPCLAQGAKGEGERVEGGGGKETKEARPEKEREADKALQQISLAGELIAYGRAHKSPESLLVAARILHENQGELVKGQPDKVDGPKDGDREKEDERAGTPAGLVQEAKEMAGDDVALKGLIAKTDAALRETARGSSEGPRYRYGYVYARGNVWYNVQFRGGYYGYGSVYPTSPTTRDLDLYIYRQPYTGTPLTSNTSSSYSAYCSWYVPYTQNYWIRVYNYSSAGGCYFRLYTN